MEGIIIRKAQLEDAAEVANVHTNSWREAYIGLIPQEYLNDRPLHFKNRYELWKRVTTDESQTTIVAESKDHGVIGFVNGAKARDKDLNDHCEVYCIYLLKKISQQKNWPSSFKFFFQEQ